MAKNDFTNSNLPESAPPDRRAHPPAHERICAVVVTFQPDPGLPARLQHIQRQVARIIVVDNASDPLGRAILDEAVKPIDAEIIHNASNLGVAAALNQGVRRARELGFEWALTLDQDSQASGDMVEELCKAYQALRDPDRVAILAPQVIEIELDRRAPFLRRRLACFYERARCEKRVLEDIIMVITSGALLRIAAFEVVGAFREDFFIDYVDSEFCLRAQRHGYSIAAACRAELYHRLGHRRRVSLGPITLFPTFHPPSRWYTISRNRIPMLRSYALRFPHWLTYELEAMVYTTVRMLITEDQRWAKVVASLRGTWDGLRGRMGKGPLASGNQSAADSSRKTNL
jgi:rhamnosyltransferase